MGWRRPTGTVADSFFLLLAAGADRGGFLPAEVQASIRRFLGACCEVTLQREECEKPWCLTDNALPCDTPQLAAGRLHSCTGPTGLAEQHGLRGAPQPQP